MSESKVEIIYSDKDILVINKPSGVSVTKDRSGAAELTDVLSRQLGTETAKRLRLVHRLDKDTSGVMILALNQKVQSLLSSSFSMRLMKKTYLAIVTGAVTQQQGRINSPLTGNHHAPNLMRLSRKKGKEAITEWRLLADFGTVALLVVSPLTGRKHQIRVHLPSVGLPLAIDPLYGSSKPLFLSDFKANYRLGKDKIEKPLIERLTLHAYQIELPEDQFKQPQVFVAGLDKKFKATIKMLTKHGPNDLTAFINSEDFDRIVKGRKLY